MRPGETTEYSQSQQPVPDDLSGCPDWGRILILEVRTIIADVSLQHCEQVPSPAAHNQRDAQETRRHQLLSCQILLVIR